MIENGLDSKSIIIHIFTSRWAEWVYKYKGQPKCFASRPSDNIVYVKQHWQFLILLHRIVRTAFQNNQIIATQMGLTQENFRALVYYDFKVGLTKEECFERLRASFGDEIPSKTTIYQWFTEFEHSRTSSSNESRSATTKKWLKRTRKWHTV